MISLVITRLSRLVVFAAGLSLIFVVSAAANHLTPKANTLAAGTATVSNCMTGSTMTFSYNLNTSSDLSATNGLVVGNIPSSCGAGKLQVELTGLVANGLPLAFSATPTIAGSPSCSLASTIYSCTFGVGTGTVAPGNVVGNYAVITGP